MKSLILLSFLFCNLSFATEVNIGVLAFNGKPQAMARWQPTAEYLSEHMPDYHFNIIPLSLEEFAHTINKNKLDFILTNPSHYVRLEVQHSINSVVTFISRKDNQALTAFSAVLFTTTDSDIRNIKDAKGKTLAAVNPQAFGGFQLAQDELLKNNIDVFSQMNIKWLGFPHVDLVKAVLSKEADIGITRSGTLENMAARGELDLSSIVVLAPKKGANFPYLRSVELFPEWPLARLPKTNLKLSKMVSNALLSMPSDATAAIKSNGSGWTVPLNYKLVHNVLKRIKAEPYLPLDLTARQLWAQYQSWLIALIILFLVLGVVLMRLYQSNQRYSQLQLELQNQQGRLEQAVIDRSEELSLSNIELQQEIKQHIKLNDALNKGCELLQAMFEALKRNDLNRNQRIQKVIDDFKKYLNLSFVGLFSTHSNQLDLIFKSSLSEDHQLLEPSFIPEITSNDLFIYRKFNEVNKRALFVPIKSNGRSYIIEMSGQNANLGESKFGDLNKNLVNFLAIWLVNEAVALLDEINHLNSQQDLEKTFELITPREREVVQLMVQGESNKSMAKLMNLSVKTIEMHRSNIIRKTNSKSSNDLVHSATASGLFE